ncbi:hypothetical protein N7474_010396 [Penicillium riverlandense]|uniref:uncharacterized protein n=1 Tax=Penicillium riverlandense TaxID=1903569 RepID=UPI0025477470|nr:uncharacterized protein N7474_010396 [Penicillium riverlandense]KAJ5806804.1 hypothetical protein N7474_010396 [Penicillium riverlandense]
MLFNTHPPSDSNHCDNGYLDLGPPLTIYLYNGIPQFWRIWETEMHQYNAGYQDTEWVLFTHVDEETFLRDFFNSPSKTITRSWNAYDKNQRLLLTRMPFTTPHEAAGRTFEYSLLKALQPMGLDTKLSTTGCATRYGKDGGKQPDGQYQPKRRPPGRTADWPALVLEVALSEPQSKLESDVRYWLRQSNGAVQVALTMKINRRIPEITIEKWARNDEQRIGRPHREQRITIRKDGKKRIEIRGGDLVIDFEKLFLRTPSIPREMDIRLGVEELQYIAFSIWQVQKFYNIDDEEADEVGQ